MRRFFLPSLVVVLPLAGVRGAETVISPVTDSVAMFKNGLAVVHASFELVGAGDYLWVDPPEAVHGAFFVESAPGLVIRSTKRLMKPDGPPRPSGNVQRDLAGAMVRASLLGAAGAPGEPVRGMVWTAPTPERTDWDTDYATTGAGRYGYFPSAAGHGESGSATGGWLVLEVEGRRHFLAAERVGQIQVEVEPPERLEVPRPVMVFSAPAAGKVGLTYLTKGMAWMPSYQLDLVAGDRLHLRQSAVVRNELMDLKGTTLELISGYPNIKFAHVESPLNAGATLAAFFQQISQEGGGQRGVLSQQIAFNSFITSNVTVPGPAVGEPDAGAPAEDLHYESIGVHELLEGDSLSIEVARAETSCERIVEWRVPDYRDEHGRVQRGREQGDEDEPWDAVQFANPLSFPMTTATASVLEDGRFRGQSMATWTPPGHTASIRVNKALTVRGEHSEVEEEGEREIVWVAGDDFQRTVVGGTLKVINTRAEPVKMVVRGDFSGELLAADGEPEKTLRADGARSVNPHRRLEWTIDLTGGEAKTLTYRYAVLVNR